MIHRFAVEFRTDAPDDIRVGDTLNVEGWATIRAITGDLVDITKLGSDPEFVLGEVEIALVSRNIRVSK